MPAGSGRPQPNGFCGKAPRSPFLAHDALDSAQKELGDLGELLTVPADVANEAEVENYVKKTVEAFGTVDVLFNNAGIEGKVQPITEVSLEDFEKVQRVNVTGVFLGMKHVLPVMMQQSSGSIINTSSNAGLDGTVNIAPYVTSKHAVSGMTKTAALEVAPHGVRVNSIHPSPVETRMMRSLESGFDTDNTEAAQKDFVSRIPLGRYGEADEIASLVLFLASEESTFITGAQYRIDGGMGATP
ncbi:SDR family oxidoreductase [Rhodococcus sp. SMB37]|uniref:SDR family NAD(P)-dependent oxidoreductase n=1 Tax=Rhodococcus sp. SMB37 TaxID=2512213 RepID=UPI0018EE817B|nr:SDR family oxidoreductase [Rhodococcus sp. SMB37]